MWKLHNGANQQWDIVCVQIPEPKKGELNEDYGLYVERPFYAISALPKGRYLDLVDNNLVIKTRSSQPSQVFWFDQKSKTIKSQPHSDWSWDGETFTKAGHMQMVATTGQELQ